MTVYDHQSTPITTETQDDGQEVNVAQNYEANQSAIVAIPDTPGPWLSLSGDEYPQNSVQTVRLPAGGVIQAGAALTIAEFAALEVVTGTTDTPQQFGKVREYDALGTDLGTFATMRVVRDPGGSFIEVKTSLGETVSA